MDNPDRDTYESWPFKEAPREYRLKVVEKIPELVNALVGKAVEVAADITTKVGYASEIASTVKQSNPGSKK